MKPTLAHRAEYLLFMGATGIGTRLGPAAADRLGGWLGRWWDNGTGNSKRDQYDDCSQHQPPAPAAFMLQNIETFHSDPP